MKTLIAQHGFPKRFDMSNINLKRQITSGSGNLSKGPLM